MADFVATKTVAVYETVEEATAALEVALEATVNTSAVRTCSIINVGGERYAAVLITTAAV